ncbi:Glutathione peroxidase 6 [Penaeus vannamei]|uniref:Glutathione peroxidase 6 n=1 Tax=Penaeus vannamei TaxID=6689 RepID=A0A3R7P1N3_PENVA|nr:Glutathione peroxidase 6 [Penaeus vannamei]
MYTNNAQHKIAHMPPRGQLKANQLRNHTTKQEPSSTETEILQGIKHVRPGGGFVPQFDLLEKVEVNGNNQNDIWKWMTTNCGFTQDRIEEASNTTPSMSTTSAGTSKNSSSGETENYSSVTAICKHRKGSRMTSITFWRNSSPRGGRSSIRSLARLEGREIHRPDITAW